MKRLHLNEPFANACLALHRYPDTNKLASMLASHHNVNAENILLVSGADQGIDVVFRHLEPASQVTILTPDFPRYETLAKINRHDIDRIPFQESHYPSTETICAALRDKKSKLFLTSTVSNPVGCAIPEKSIEALQQKKPEATLLVIDEVYSPYLGYDHAQFIASQPGKNSLGIFSLSKLGYSGFRIGYCIANHEIIKSLQPYVSRFALSTPCVEMAESLLKGHEWRTLIARQIENREWLTAQFLKRGLTVRSSAANWVLLYLADTAMQTVDMLQEKGFLVQLQPQLELKGWVRISTPIERDVLVSFLKALDEVLTSLYQTQTIAA